jgi:hypothetical protein
MVMQRRPYWACLAFLAAAKATQASVHALTRGLHEHATTSERRCSMHERRLLLLLLLLCLLQVLLHCMQCLLLLLLLLLLNLSHCEVLLI